jgi:outer membrane receptor for ferrienterochelin and colicin
MKTAYENKEIGIMLSLRTRWVDKKIVNDRRQNNQTLTGAVTESEIVSPAYAITDVKIMQDLPYHVQLSLGVNNLFDKTVFPFGQLKGREFFAGLRYHIF